MKKRIINLAMGLTALIASFLPQKAQAVACVADCDNGWCVAIGFGAKCYCDAGENPVCDSA